MTKGSYGGIALQLRPPTFKYPGKGTFLATGCFSLGLKSARRARCSSAWKASTKMPKFFSS